MALLNLALKPLVFSSLLLRPNSGLWLVFDETWLGISVEILVLDQTYPVFPNNYPEPASFQLKKTPVLGP